MKQVNQKMQNNSPLGNNGIKSKIRGEIFTRNTPETENIDRDLSKIKINKLINQAVKEDITRYERGLE